MNKFSNNLDDTIILLKMLVHYSEPKEQLILLKSSVVLTIAYWERFIEDLILEGCLFISEGLRDPHDLPKVTRQKVALFSITEDRVANPEKFSDSIWSFSAEGWGVPLLNYVNDLTSKLNTVDTKRIKESFFPVFGIRNILDDWKNPNPDSKDNCTAFDAFVTKRHEIAHGSDIEPGAISIDYVFACIKLLLGLADHISKTMWNQIGLIVQKSANEYGLASRYIYDIITYFGKNGPTSLNTSLMKQISTTAYANYRKLAYEPWKLLKVDSISNIKPTSDLFKFLRDEITLPKTIFVLKKEMAFPKSNTEYLKFSDLRNIFSS